MKATQRRKSHAPAQVQDHKRQTQQQNRQQRQHEVRQRAAKPASAPLAAETAPPAAETAPPASADPSRPQRGRPPDHVVVFAADLPQPGNIPTKFAKFLNEYGPEMQDWINNLVIHKHGERDLQNKLTNLEQTQDITALVETCAAYYSPDEGAPATYTIEQLVRAEIVRALHASCGDDELADLIRRKITIRTYLNLSIFDDTPSAATLHHFRSWLDEHHPTLFSFHV